MKFRTTLIAAVLLAILGGYIYFFEYRKAQEEKDREETEKKVFSIDWEELKGLKVVDSYGTFVMEKVRKGGEEKSGGQAQDQEWRLLEPVKTDGDDLVLNGLVSALKGLEIEQVVSESPESLEPFGLKEPSLKIGMEMSGGGQTLPLLLVGDKSPVGENSYAMKEGEARVLLLSTFLDTQFDKSLYDFRRKKVFSFRQDEVDTVGVLKQGEVRLELVREGGKWRVTEPFRARAVESEASGLLEKITALKAEAFDDEHPEDLTPYGLADPDWEIRLTLGPDQTRATLLLGKTSESGAKGWLYAKRGETPQIVSLKGDLVEALDKKAEGYREQKVFPFQSWKVDKLELIRKEETLTLEKHEAGKWRVTAPAPARAAASKVTAFLSALSRLEGQKFMEKPGEEQGLAEFGLAPPLVEVRLFQEDVVAAAASEAEQEQDQRFSEIGTLLLGRVKGRGTPGYAYLKGEETLARVSNDFFKNDLPDGLESLRDKKLLAFYRYQVAEIDYQGPEGAVVLKKKEETWKVRKPRSGDAEEQEVNDLISALSELEAERVLGKAVGGAESLGLDPPSRRVTLRDTKGKELGTVLVSDKGPEGEEALLYAQAQGDAWIGLLNTDKDKEIQDKFAPFLGTDGSSE